MGEPRFRRRPCTESKLCSHCKSATKNYDLIHFFFGSIFYADMLSVFIAFFWWFFLCYNLAVFSFAVHQWAKRSSLPMSIERGSVHSTLRRFQIFFILLLVFSLPFHRDSVEANPLFIIACAILVPVVTCMQILMWRKEAYLAEAAVANLMRELCKQV